ncbi:MAG: acetate--CoA ligase family protein [Atribacterota bacterium]|nr:acetate--CoA ligase family protein [Atribacterota bacterium]
MDSVLELAIKEKRNLTEAEAYEVLSKYGIPVPKYSVVSTEEEVLQIAKKLGFPLVMKIVSPDIMHKTDIGGIEMNISNLAQIKKAYKNIICSIRKNKPEARIKGVLLYKQAPKGVEVIVGMIRDSQFGPTVMFGLGGIFIEILKDVTFRVCTVERADIEEMLTEIQGIKMLQDYRGQARCDINAIIDIILEISRLALDYPVIKGIDLNPILVYEKGTMVVDAKVFLKGR